MTTHSAQWFWRAFQTPASGIIVKADLSLGQIPFSGTKRFINSHDQLKLKTKSETLMQDKN